MSIIFSTDVPFSDGGGVRTLDVFVYRNFQFGPSRFRSYLLLPRTRLRPGSSRQELVES